MQAKRIFEILMRENADMLHPYLRASVRDSNVADDLFQATMLVAWKRLEDFDQQRSFKGSNQFALRRPALIPNANLWLGSDGKDTWLVPSIGPIRVGDETGLGKWLAKREVMNSPMLQIETMLARMKKGYELIQEEDEVLTTADGATIKCQHLIGKLFLKDLDSLPARIDLWCDKETGTAIRVKAAFTPKIDRRGRVQTTIDFAGELELAEDWFQANGHYRGFRRTMRFDSEDEQIPEERGSDRGTE